MSKKAKAPNLKAAEQSARQAVIDTAIDMSLSQLSPGRSGNVSCRWNDGMLITPSGMAYEELEPADAVFVQADGTVPEGQRMASSEWHFHLAVYAARPDMNAVVHTHSLNATVLACAHKSIPAFHYMVAAAGGDDIPLVPYATFGTAELAAHVATGLKNRDACLMANHGQIAIGASLAAALDLAHQVEILAEQYLKVLLLGPPHIIPPEEMKIVLAKFKSYGQRGQDKGARYASGPPSPPALASP